MSKTSWLKLLALGTIPLLSGIKAEGGMALNMPGSSYRGNLPALSPDEAALSMELKKHVQYLAETIGERNLAHYDGLNKSAEYLAEQFKAGGCKPEIQEYKAPAGFLRSKWQNQHYEQQIYKNIVVAIKGTEKPDEIIVIGAHYDSVPIAGCKGANDNASGVAATLALAKYFAAKPQKRTLRFVAFANEEPPFFWTKCMGSYVYARSCKAKNEKIIAMLTTETIGFYSDEAGSQKYPFPLSWFYPSKGNFIAFAGNTGSETLIKQCVKSFRDNAKFPSEGACIPRCIPHIGFSDHWSFWKMDYPALMITDTAMFRYKYYHTASDNYDMLDYDRMARVVEGLKHVAGNLASE
ncbi:MAG: M28 family peptidase [Lentisphaerota bacterium]